MLHYNQPKMTQLQGSLSASMGNRTGKAKEAQSFTGSNTVQRHLHQRVTTKGQIPLLI